jgi:hypothetical protein
MLRSGYSSDAVLRELVTRHFADVFDATVEQQLVRAGANEALINALRGGSYAAAASEISAASERAAKEKRTVLFPDRDAQHLKPPPSPAPALAGPAGTPTPLPAPSDAIYQLLRGDLVHLERGEIRKLDDEAISKKKLYLLFFSSNSSEPARNFTPSLVAFYHRVAPHHPEFETIFFSHDPTAFGMDKHMQRADMPWPAVVFEKVAVKFPVAKNARNLPVLILVTGNGKTLYSSSGIQNADPEKVMADLDQILSTSSADPNAPPPKMLSNPTDSVPTQVK